MGAANWSVTRVAGFGELEKLRALENRFRAKS